LRIEEEERKKKEAEERRLMGIDEKEEEEKKKKNSKKQSAAEVDDEGDENDDGDKKADVDEEEEEPKPKVEEWKPYIPEVPNRINWAHYSTPDTFWLSMDDYDAGYLYECKFFTDEEKANLPTDKVDDPISHIAVQKSDLIFNDDIPLNCITFK
jgi:hypothetical protein